ncbi:MAG: hypothetical protein ACI9MC_003804, partial [Kiritimatiellia bacterium]
MKSRRVRWLLGTLVTLGVLLALLCCGGVLGLRSPWFQDWLADTIITEADGATHELTQLDSASLSFFPPGVQIEHLRLIEDTSGDEILHAEHIFAALVLRGGKPGLGRLSVRGLHVHLHVDAKGKLTEFTSSGTQFTTPNSLTKLPWSSLE